MRRKKILNLDYSGHWFDKKAVDNKEDAQYVYYSPLNNRLKFFNTKPKHKKEFIYRYVGIKSYKFYYIGEL